MTRNKSEKKPERDASIGHEWGDCPYGGLVFGESQRQCKHCQKQGYPSASKEPCITKVMERLKSLEQEVAAYRAASPLVI